MIFTMFPKEAFQRLFGRAPCKYDGAIKKNIELFT